MITTRIEEPGLDGVLTSRDSDRPLPGVLALGGSDGGVPTGPGCWDPRASRASRSLTSILRTLSRR